MTELTPEQLYEEHKRIIAESKNKLRVLTNELLLKKAKELFDNFEELEEFTWTQFTPHFNDGDPCEFRVNELVYLIEDYDEEYPDENPYFYTTEDLNRYEKYLENSIENGGKTDRSTGWLTDTSIMVEIKRAKDCLENNKNMGNKFKTLTKDFEDFFRTLDEDILRSSYGDGVRVTFRRNEEKPEIDEYDHD